MGTERAVTHLSVSTWQQPVPERVSAERSALVEGVAQRTVAVREGRVRVGIDGRTAAGKTSFGHELAMAINRGGRPVLRASLDDFKRPWRDRHRDDRLSGEGYYRNAFDLDAIRRLLLDPAAPGGSGRCVLCSIDPITQIDHSDVVDVMAPDAVLIVDGVFAFRPGLNDAWDLRIWLDVDAELSVRRGVERDGGRRDREDVEALHRDRYLASEEIYLAEVDARARADVVIDNTDLTRPLLLRPRSGG